MQDERLQHSISLLCRLVKIRYWHRISLKPEGRHTVEPRHFLNMPDVYYVAVLTLIGIQHREPELSRLRLDVVGYPPRGNSRHCALYAGSSTYAALIRGYRYVTLSSLVVV